MGENNNKNKFIPHLPKNLETCREDEQHKLIFPAKFDVVQKGAGFIDSAFSVVEKEVFSSVFEKENAETGSTLFSHGRRTESFFTEDSKLYITPLEQERLTNGLEIRTGISGFDSLSSRIVDNYRQFRPSEKDVLFKKLVERYSKIQGNIADIPNNILKQISIAKLWNMSIICSIVIGMISMTFIYRYLGTGVDAKKPENKAPIEQVMGVEDIKSDEETVQYIEDVMAKLEEVKKEEFENQLKEIVEGYPIEKMLPHIIEKDRTVAAFLIGIAKKESNWGKRVPVLNGQDCYNYWGYRGQRKLMGTGGHTCFNSRKDAVDTVAKRLEFLIKEKKLDTPEKLVIWKCGSACDKDNQKAVRKWISDVDIYFKKLN